MVRPSADPGRHITTFAWDLFFGRTALFSLSPMAKKAGRRISLSDGLSRQAGCSFGGGRTS